ncbi:MAG: glycosyltransferase family 4 protein [Alkalilacustris sp.]
MDRKDPVRILVSVPFAGGWTWLSRYFEGEPYCWTFLRADLLRAGRKGLIPHAFRTARRARHFDLVVTHGPWLCLFTVLFMRVLGRRQPLLAFTFNHGNGKFFAGPFLWLARRVLPNVALFVTHSEMEREIFAGLYGIPRDRIRFTHWAVAAPPAMDRAEEVSRLPYVCCIGRNNRDFDTFIAAVSRSGIRGILICGAGQLKGREIPDAVSVRFDVPKAECDAVMAQALATVVPLRDDSTGAGHMTIVTSLLLGTPVIATDSPAVRDYVHEGETGLLVPRGSAEAMAAAIRKLADDAAGREVLSQSALAFARQHLTEERAAAFLRGVLQEQAGPGAARKSVSEE